jgi:hypothetical protein
MKHITLVVPRLLPGYILGVTLRLGRCRVSGDVPLMMGDQGSGIFLGRDHVSISS